MSVSAFLLSAAVLGLAANFARLFLPHIHRMYCLCHVVGTPERFLQVISLSLPLFRHQPPYFYFCACELDADNSLYSLISLQNTIRAAYSGGNNLLHPQCAMAR